MKNDTSERDIHSMTELNILLKNRNEMLNNMSDDGIMKGEDLANFTDEDYKSLV